MTSEIKIVARDLYDELCEKNGPSWRQWPSSGHVVDGGCGSFEAWFMVNDGPELLRRLEAEATDDTI